MGLFDFRKKKDSGKTEQEKLDEIFNKGVASVSDYVKKQDEARERENREAIKMADYISGGIKQFNSAPGALRSYDVASSEAKKFAEEHRDVISNHGFKGDSKIIEDDDKDKEFNNKFPEYLELKQILEDRKKGVIDVELDKLVSALEKTAQQKYPNFVFEDLIVPFLLEKRSMGLTNMDEFIFLEQKWDGARLHDDLSEEEYAKRIVNYVSLIGAFFRIKENETKDFVGRFTYCLSNAAGYTDLLDEENEFEDSSKPSGIRK